MKRCVPFLLGVLILFGSILLSCKKNPEKPDKDRISRSELNRKIDSLIQQAEKEGDPNAKAKLYGEASLLLSQKGDLKRMYETAYLGKKENPYQKQSLTSLAEYHLRRGNSEESKIQLLDVLSREPNFPRANHLLGLYYMQKGETKQASLCFQKAYLGEPENPDYGTNLLTAVYESGDKAKSTSLAKTLTEKFPDHGPIWKNAGIVFEGLGKKGEAKAAFEKYLELHPNGTDSTAVRKWISKLK